MKKDKEKLTEEQKEEKQARTNKILSNIYIVLIIIAIISAIILFGISCSTTKSSSNSWEKDANSIGYEKKSDGRWYYVGDVSDILMK